MPFTLESFSRSRPLLYHLTAKQNLERIRKCKRLDGAAVLMRAGGNSTLLTKKRETGLDIEIAGETVHIRDQSPLYEGNIRFGDGWSLARLIEELNKRVFFWAGGMAGPISYGVRHFERYREEQPAILRVPFATLLAHNSDVQPLFCKFNSGSPRCSGGLGSIRSLDTFVRAEKATFTSSKVVEVTFLRGIDLPDDVEISTTPNGPWRRLLSTNNIS